MFPGETILSGADTDGASEFKVMATPAGWYIGTSFEGMPNTRESIYFGTSEQAEGILADWLRVVIEDIGPGCRAKRINSAVIEAARFCYEEGLLQGAR